MYEVFANGESIYDPMNSAYYLFNPKIQLEFGKAGSFEFVIPPSNFYYSSLKQMKTIVTVEFDGVEIFRGRVLNINTEFNKLKTVYCEGDLAYLVDSVQKAVKYSGTTHALFSTIIQAHNAMVEAEKHFAVGTVNIDNLQITLTGKSDDQTAADIDYRQIAIDSMADNWASSFDYIQNCLIDYCGGYLKTRRSGNTTYIDFFKSYARVSSQIIEFGVNMLDFTEEASVEDEEFCTVLIPLGDDNLTIESVNNGSKELVNQTLVNRYGRIVRTHSFSNVSQATTLLENARRYMEFNEEPPVTITVKAIDLHFTNSDIAAIMVGDQVTIKSSPHNVSRSLVCTEIEYDLTNPANTSYTFGNPKQSLTRRYKEDKRQTNDANSADGLSGGVGGAAAGIGAANWKLVEDETEKVKQQIYEEWIDIDPANPDAVGSLGGLYREYANTKAILEREVGIHFNGEEGNISLTALQRGLDEQGELVDQRIAGVESTVNEEITEARLYAATLVEGVEDKVAELKVYVDDQDQTIIAGKADKIELTALETSIRGEFESDINDVKDGLKNKVGIDLDAATGQININTLSSRVDQQGNEIAGNAAAISAVSNDLGSRVTQIATYTNQNTTKIASLELTADNLGTRLNAKADTVTINANLTEINGRLTAIDGDIQNLKAKKITSAEIEALIGNISVLRVNSLNVAGTVVASQIYSGGTVDGGHLVATWDAVASRLNNITQANSPGNAHYHYLTENQDGTISIGYATSTPQSFNITATKAYRDGVAAAVAAVRVKSIEKRVSPVYGEEHYNPDTHMTTIFLKAIGYDDQELGTGAVNTSTAAYEDGYSKGVEQGAGQGYNEGRASVTISAVYKDPDLPVSRSSSGGHHYIDIPLKAMASNNATGTGSTRILADDEYNEGLTAGAQGVTVNTPVRSATDSYDRSTHKTTLKIVATATNNEQSPVGTFITSTAAYEHGDSDGFARCDFDGNLSRVSSTEDVSNKQVKYKIQAKLTNGKTKTTEFTQSTATTYSTGEAAGRSSVRITDIGVTSKISSNGRYYDLTLKLSGTNLSNEMINFTKTYSTGTVPYTNGRDSVGISSNSISLNTTDVGGRTINVRSYVTLDNGKTANFWGNVSGSALYNAGYNEGYSNGYEKGKQDAVPALNRITTLYVTAIFGSDSVGLRAYHSDGGYSYARLWPGDYWDGYD